MIPTRNIPTIPRDTYQNLPAAYTFVDPQTRGSIAVESPRVVFIEVTNHCNLLCETCPRTFVSYEEPQTLSWENFLKIVEQFPKMERAVLHGIGEPLINRDLPRMISHLKERGVTVLFNTNATLLTEEWGRKLIDSGLDEMRCSIDGAKTETYAKIRGAPLLHKIVGNLTKFTELQRKMGKESPKASIWMTGMRENIEELPDLVRLASRMGVKEVYVQRMVYYLDNVNPPGLMDAGHALFDTVLHDVFRHFHADGGAQAAQDALHHHSFGLDRERQILGNRDRHQYCDERNHHHQLEQREACCEPRRTAARPSQPHPAPPLNTLSRFHHGRNTPSARINTMTPTTVIRMG